MVHEDCNTCHFPIFVLAPTLQAMRDYVRGNGESFHHYIFLNHIDQLRGQNGSVLFIIGRRDEIPLYEVALQHARAYRLRLVYDTSYDPVVPFSKHLQSSEGVTYAAPK